MGLGSALAESIPSGALATQCPCRRPTNQILGGLDTMVAVGRFAACLIELSMSLQPAEQQAVGLPACTGWCRTGARARPDADRSVWGVAGQSVCSASFRFDERQWETALRPARVYGVGTPLSPRQKTCILADGNESKMCEQLLYGRQAVRAHPRGPARASVLAAAQQPA